MEPDPSIYLRAIRREAISVELFGDGLASGASRVHMSRAGECLAQIIFRRDRLPELIRRIKAKQAALLEQIVQRLGELHAQAPESALRAEQALQHEPQALGEEDIVLYDLLMSGIADGVRALRRQPHAEQIALELCLAGCAIEASLRDQYESELIKFKREMDGLESQAQVLRAPTPPQLTAYLRSRFPADRKIEVTEVRRLVADNSKDIFFFDVIGSERRAGSYVMRREPAYNVTQARLVEEYEIMADLENAGIPVAAALLGEGDPSHFGGGFVVTRRAQGATRTAAALGPQAKNIMKRIAELSAKIHSINVSTVRAKWADGTMPLAQRILKKIDGLYCRWLAEKTDETVIVEAAYAWLCDHVKCLDSISVLTHGDYNLRNFLLEGDEISAVLDWEFSCVSHPAEDVAYIRADVEQVMPWQEYLDAYHAKASYRISDEALAYFAVYIEFWRTVLGASCFSGYRRGEHCNFVFATTVAVEYPHCLRMLAASLGRVRRVVE